MDIVNEASPALSEDIEVTDEYKKVLGWLKAGAPIVFVSGKAGTGKTTFIRYLRETFDKHIVVVAPTGVAALNIEGATIHSFFHFPPRVVTNDDVELVRDRRMYQKLSLLIIDEVSMVRADVIDAMDKFLRKNRQSSEPFGGVQLLLVGDLFQLSPVVNHNEQEALNSMGYETPYFFSADAFVDRQMLFQDLNKVFRQSDPDFIDILNKIRLAEELDIVLPLINERYIEDLDLNQTIITLTSTNRVADRINAEHLRDLSGAPTTFAGEVSGRFAVENTKLPSPLNLALKVGAQVMFTKNDGNRRWINGTLGKVVELNKDLICVEVTDSTGTFVHEVERVTWEYFKYRYDAITEEILPEETGRYTQFPLMLAWAVTIHKGQGKTLEKVQVDLGRGAFAYGQVYVALSRCRSLEDIYLMRPIQAEDVKCDPVVKEFYSALNS
jgi:ATP-dependent DNA helicase PIF1